MLKEMRNYLLYSSRTLPRGFTLVELLIVIVIIAVLAAIIALLVNPAELIKRGRDAQRLSDFNNLHRAINIVIQDSTNSSQALLCNGVVGSCTSNSTSGTRVPNGGGWVKVNLSVQTVVSLASLPIDPVNSTGATGNHYVYCSNGTQWELFTNLESQQQQSRLAADGGGDNTKYEVGSNLNLVNTTLPAPNSVACSY